MKKVLLAGFFLFSILGQASLAEDQDRMNALRSEVSERQIEQYLLTFENYPNMLNGNSGDTMAANSIVESLNALSKKYPTINTMHALLVELIDSGYYENPPMLMYNLKFSLERAKEYGFGSGKISPWQFKHMIRFKPKSACGNAVENVFYTTVKHPSKNYAFGFYMSAGYGIVGPQILNTKVIGEECY